MKYSEWLSDWFENYVCPSSKNKTIQCYKSLIQNHIIPLLGDYDIDELNPLALQKAITSLSSAGNARHDGGLSSSSINLIITILQSSLRTAFSLGYSNKYLGDKIKRPKIKEKLVDSFTLSEQKKIEKEVINHKNPKMIGILLCLYTGLRIGELLALEWSDINFKKQEISVTKSCFDSIDGQHGLVRITETPKTESSLRTIPFPKQLVPILREAKAKNESIYVVGNANKPISVRSYQRTFDLLLKRLNIPHKGFHALRHTFATRASENGMDAKALSEILGHKNPTITLKRYTHSFMSHKKQMINRLGKLL